MLVYPHLIFDDGLHKIGKSVWTKGVISLIVGLRCRILELNQPMKILNIEPTHEKVIFSEGHSVVEVEDSVRHSVREVEGVARLL